MPGAAFAVLDLLEAVAGFVRALDVVEMAVGVLRNRWVQRCLGALLLLASVPLGTQDPTLGGVVVVVGALALVPDLRRRLRS